MSDEGDSIMAANFPHLFSPIVIRGIPIKNRILSTGHMTTLVTGCNPNESMIAYHKALAKGGVGLIVIGSTSLLTT